MLISGVKLQRNLPLQHFQKLRTNRVCFADFGIGTHFNDLRIQNRAFRLLSLFVRLSGNGATQERDKEIERYGRRNGTFRSTTLDPNGAQLAKRN